MIKIILFPVTLALSILVVLLNFLVDYGGTLANIVAGLLFTIGVVLVGGKLLQVTGVVSSSWGTILIPFVCAFLLSPYGLTVIEHPKGRGQRFAEKAAAKHGRSFKERLRQTIDNLLPASKDFEDFLAHMSAEGYEVKQGKYLEFRAPDQIKFTRSFRLGDDYTEKALCERITGRPVRQAAKKTPYRAGGKKVNLLIDIQAKMQAGKSRGYERWATIFNLKEAAKTLNFHERLCRIQQ